MCPQPQVTERGVPGLFVCVNRFCFCLARLFARGKGAGGVGCVAEKQDQALHALYPHEHLC